MPQTVRTFLAATVTCPAALRPVLRALGEMGRAVRPVSPDHLHVTLKFLGEVPLERTPAIGQALAEAARGLTAFEMELRGLGAFPHPARPSVIWSGLAGAETLGRLVDALEPLLERQGFPREARAFHPHVTLARIRSRPPDELRSLLQRDDRTSFGVVAVEEVELLQSEPGPQGSRYTPLARVVLRHPMAGAE